MTRRSYRHQPSLFDIQAAREVASNLEASGAKVLRIWANGYDVTDQMPLTKAELEKQYQRRKP